jgi:TonB-linked SusC/RagA family outer membrane protein
LSNNTQFYNSKYKYQGLEGGGNPNFVSVTVHALPAYAPVNPDGTATYNTLKNNYSIGDGVYALLLDGKAGGMNTTNEVITTSSMIIDVSKNLKILGDYSYTLYLTDNWYRTTVTKYSIEPGILQEVPNFNSDQMKQTRVIKPMKVANLYTNFNQDFNKHHVSGTAGVNYEYTNYSRLYGLRKNLLSETLNDLNLGTGDQETSGGAYEYTLFGAFFRGNYNYAGKYLLEVNGRYDGTSRFGEGQRFGFFPSVSLGYRISEESFFEPVKGIVNNLKIRFSQGTLGNQLPSSTSSANYYPYISLMPTAMSSWITNDQKLQYVNNPRPIAPYLTWEKTKTSNIGIDADFLKSRLNFSADAYIRKTVDMLVPGKVLPTVFGASVPTENAGDLETKGFEISLAWRDKFNLHGKSFSYNVALGVSDYTSTITKYDNPNNLLSNYYVGQEIGEIWGYSIDGFFKSDEEAQNFTIDQSLINRQRLNSPGVWSKLQAGDLKFIDTDGDKKITPGKNTLDDPGDRKIIGNTSPRYRFGLNVGFNWNGFDFSSFIQGIGRRDWYPGNNADKFWGPYSRPYFSFIPKDFEKDVWTAENPDAYFPLLRGYTALNGSNDLNSPNDKYIQNAGYIRLKNLVVGYTLPKKWLDKINIEKLRIYLSGENLGYYSPMRTKYIDPEQLDGDGTNGRTYPMSKTLSVGMDISF